MQINEAVVLKIKVVWFQARLHDDNPLDFLCL
jgi:hypothetical protein